MTAAGRVSTALSQPELAELLRSCRTMTLVTVGADRWPHAVPMWFASRNDSILFMTYRRSQKSRNIERDNRVVCVFEAGLEYRELRGAQMRGYAEELTAARERRSAAYAIAARYSDDGRLDSDEVTRQIRGRRVYRVTPAGTASWDHRSLGGDGGRPPSRPRTANG